MKRPQLSLGPGCAFRLEGRVADHRCSADRVEPDPCGGGPVVEAVGDDMLGESRVRGDATHFCLLHEY